MRVMCKRKEKLHKEAQCIGLQAMVSISLLPTGSEEREVLGVGSIPVAILPSCQDMNPIALQLHAHEYSWVVKIKNTSEAVLRSQYSP